MASPRPSRSNGFVPDIKEGSVHNTTAKSREGSDSNVSFKDDQSKENILNFSDRSPRKNLQRATESRGSSESSVSVKSDWLRDFISDVKDRSPLKVINHKCSPARSRRPILNIQERSSHRSDFCIFKDPVSDDKGLVKSSDDQRAMQSLESIDSGVSLKSDRSNRRMIDFKDRVSPSRWDSSSSEKKHDVSDDEDLVKSPDSQTSVKSGELSDSNLSFKSDRSNGRMIDFKDGVSPSSQDLSTSELEDIDDDEELDESSDDDLEKTVVERGV